MGQTHQSITINAPAERVWRTIRNFHDMSWAPNVITQMEAIGDIPGDKVGAMRLLNGVFHETLLEFDEARRTLAYRIDDGPSPVSRNEVKNYVGRVRVQPTATNGALVEWSSTWEQNDQPAYDFCHGIYLALLADMKKSLE